MILDTLSSTACASRACQVRPAYSGMSASGREHHRLRVAYYVWGRIILIRTYIDCLESLNGVRWLLQYQESH